MFVWNAINAIWLFTVYKPEFKPSLSAVRLTSARTLLGVGGLFFLIQLCSLVMFQTDNLVIAKFKGAVDVPAYSITYGLFAYSYLPQTILFNYLWVAYADAISRKDIAWVTRSFRRNLLVSVASTFVLVIPLVLIGRTFIRLWAGEAVVPPIDLVIWMAAWSMINAVCSPMACLFSAANHLKAQVIYSAAGSVANIAITIYLIKSWGITGVVAGTVISYLIFIVVPATIDVSLLLRKLRNAVQGL
jgi:O-antigen/teichoic acid export membrane protein